VVAEELNFTWAAERLQMTQPPLSRQIQSLEKSLQVQLFERTNRKVILTPAGRIFFDECQRILQSVDQSIRTAKRAARGEIGQLTIGFEGSFHNETLLNIIQQFRDRFPDVELILQEMTSGQQMEALKQKLIGVGFADPLIRGDDISLLKLAEEPLVAMLPRSHALWDQPSIDLSQLSGEPWITGQHGKGCGLLTRIQEACSQWGFEPRVHQETNDIQMILGFVASGLGVTLLPSFSSHL
jgi:DNA-binding transcriptional LysR family regulator